MRERVPVALRERVRVAVRLRLRLRLRLRVPVALTLAGGVYAHANPLETCPPLTPPTWR